jgi:predicted Fe-Mo cluster-binding NifX family protein
MIAIPLKTGTSESAIAPLFGKAKWFALIDEAGAVTFWQNSLQSGREVVEHFKTLGVTRVVFQDMGGNPYLMLTSAGIECYHAGHGRILLAEALDFMKKGSLIRVTPENMSEYVERPHRHRKEEHQHLHHCGERHGHHAHHGHGHHAHGH